eukprot:365660-Chlamydomonas_euryale.AAC.12
MLSSEQLPASGRWSHAGSATCQKARGPFASRQHQTSKESTPKYTRRCMMKIWVRPPHHMQWAYMLLSVRDPALSSRLPAHCCEGAVADCLVRTRA